MITICYETYHNLVPMVTDVIKLLKPECGRNKVQGKLLGSGKQV